jgi:hypothetical protein
LIKRDKKLAPEREEREIEKKISQAIEVKSVAKVAVNRF